MKPASVLLAVCLSSCGAPPPPPPPPTVVNVTLAATGDVNAGPSGGAPVAIRLYLLDNASNFKGANFFPIFDNDKATLKDDLIKREDMLLAPSATKTLTLHPDDRAHSLGVFAAYRDWQHATWRGAVDVPAHQTSAVKIVAGATGLEVAIAPETASK